MSEHKGPFTIEHIPVESDEAKQYDFMWVLYDKDGQFVSDAEALALLNRAPLLSGVPEGWALASVVPWSVILVGPAGQFEEGQGDTPESALADAVSKIPTDEAGGG